MVCSPADEQRALALIWHREGDGVKREFPRRRRGSSGSGRWRLDSAPSGPILLSVKTLSPDGTRIAYEVRGTGTVALVFVHGWSCDRSYWAGQLGTFSRDFQAVAVDLGGHGDSGVGRDSWTIESFGEDVAAVAEGLGLTRVILIGHSMGGDVIVEAARRLPGRVLGLIWVDVYKRLGSPRSPEQVRTLMAPFRASFVETTRAFVRGMFPPDADTSLVEWVAADMSAAPPAIALAAMESAMSCEPEVTAAVMELGLPAIAINGDDPPTDVESMGRHGFDVVLMPRVGHFPMMEAPERFNGLLGEAISKLLLRAGAARP
jgi:pimeloyl-ACP methyl ester carboxylesterase